MTGLINYFRRRRRVRLSIDNVPLLRELGHPDGALGNSHGSDWFVCHYGKSWKADFCRKNRYISVENFLWWCHKNNINPWGK
jgi:hypothetical protein